VKTSMFQQDPLRISRGLHKLRVLRTYDGAPEKFWTVFLDSSSDLAGADTGLIIEKVQGKNPFKVLAEYDGNTGGESLKTLHKMIPATMQKCSCKNVTIFSTKTFSVFAVPLIKENCPPTVYVLLKVATIKPEEISAISMALSSIIDVPMQYQRQSEAVRVLQDREKILNVLDLNVLLNSQPHFLSAVMLLCNEIASAYKCTRVSLGWCKGRYIRLKAMSQADSFEKKMEIVQKAEAAMEEAAEQNTEIRIPAEDNDGSLYVRDHESYQRATSTGALLTLPIRHNNDVVGVCLLERTAGEFTDADVQHIRMSIDQVSARIHDLYLNDRWAGAKLADWGRQKVAVLLGFEHTWMKLIALVSAAALIAVMTVPVRYRVDSPMILKTDDITFLAAPFDGYISSVNAKAGESVDKGKVILSLDKKDLILEEAGIQAEFSKTRREEDKFRADVRLAEMRVSQAQSEQLYSRLNIVQLRLSKADVKAPFKGIIIEGDQHERIGSPVKQGEVLFKLGRIEDIRVEAKVSESEIQNIMPGARGQVALTSRPNEFFDITVQRIEPAAVSDQAGNIFQVVCSFNNQVPQWFRPGMTGVSKIEAGKKTLFWVVSHRTFDFLRLKLWW